MPEETQIIRRGHGTPVLIVEDIATEAFTLRKVLERADYQVTLATTGQEALRLLAMREFRLVITDIQLTDGSGLDLVAALRKSYGDKIPVIVVSGNAGDDELMEKIRSVGATKYLTKPVGRRKLFDEIKQLLGV